MYEKTTIAFGLGIGSLLLLAGVAHAATVTVHVGGYYFDPQFPAVQPGDTIQWVWDDGQHDVTSGPTCTEDSGLFYHAIDSSNQIFEWTIPSSHDGTLIPYYCSIGNHCVASNQYGGLLVNTGAVHYVTTNGYVFEPTNVNVTAGDVVVWIHAGGSHTVTSGSNCTPDGRFDEALDNISQMPFYVVPTDSPSEVIDYYCNPHCNFGMVGSITVIGTGGCPEDLDGNGLVGVDDLLMLLAAYGNTCACPEDINESGTVDVDDLLMLLAAYGQDC